MRIRDFSKDITSNEVIARMQAGEPLRWVPRSFVKENNNKLIDQRDIWLSWRRPVGLEDTVFDMFNAGLLLCKEEPETGCCHYYLPSKAPSDAMDHKQISEELR